LKIEDFIVYESPLEKKRYGRAGDGGYVGVRISSDVLLSGGIGNDISFELDYVENNHCDAMCYDHQFGNRGSLSDFLADNRFKNHSHYNKLNFFEKMVDVYNAPTKTNFEEYFHSYDRISLKLDIEGGEYKYFDWLLEEYIHKLDQIFVEVHMLGHPRYKNSKIIEKINKTHALIHAHGNNTNSMVSNKYTEIDGVLVPIIIELTFLHKQYFDTIKPNQQELPHECDQPNQILLPELLINHYPFVSC